MERAETELSGGNGVGGSTAGESPAADSSARGRTAWRKALRRIYAADGGTAGTVAVAYILIGLAWIAWSDALLGRMVADPTSLTRWQTYKGWAFVLTSGALIYGLVRASLWLRDRARRRRRESERFLARLTGNLPGMIYRCRNDADWTMEYVSPAVRTLTGFSADELTDNRSTSWAALIHPDDRPRVRRAVERALERDARFQVEYRIRTAEGRERWVWEQGCPVYDAEDRLLHLEGFVADISDRKEAEAGLRERMARLRALREIDLAITGSLDLGLSLRVVLEQVTGRLRVDAACILLLNPHSDILEHAAARGFRTDALRHTRLRLGDGPAGRAAMEAAPVLIPDLREAPDRFGRSPQIVAEEFVTYLAVPLVAKGRVRGVLEVFHRTPLDPDDEWRAFLETLAGQAAIAVDSAGLFEDLQRANRDLRRAYDETIEGWARALDLRDHETVGHTRRVAELAVRLGKKAGLSDEQLVHLRRGALLHDIGKVGIPDDVLLKPGPLTDEEWEVMRRHPQYAFELLSPIEYLRPALDIPYCHHEKWDGTGYPRGLRGEQIPLAARAFAVVDVWDALRSDRPYRDAWSEERVRRHLREEAGSHFDPEMVALFLEMEPDLLVQTAAPDPRRVERKAPSG